MPNKKTGHGRFFIACCFFSANAPSTGPVETIKAPEGAFIIQADQKRYSPA
jgi:hypothetical protein